MKPFTHFLLSGALVLACAPAAFATQRSGETRAPATIDPAGKIERGGTVSIVDLKKKIFVVDGVGFKLPAAPLPIHPPPEAPRSKAFELKAGMHIRFNTSKANWSGQEQVTEIWVTDLGDKSARR